MGGLYSRKVNLGNFFGKFRRHYGLTEEELDCLVNYDVKFRTDGERLPPRVIFVRRGSRGMR